MQFTKFNVDFSKPIIDEAKKSAGVVCSWEPGSTGWIALEDDALIVNGSSRLSLIERWLSLGVLGEVFIKTLFESIRDKSRRIPFDSISKMIAVTQPRKSPSPDGNDIEHKIVHILIRESGRPLEVCAFSKSTLSRSQEASIDLFDFWNACSSRLGAGKLEIRDDRMRAVSAAYPGRHLVESKGIAATQLLQMTASCRNCGKVFTFQEASRPVVTNGVMEVVIMCPACYSIFQVHATPQGFTLLADVSQQYAQQMTARPASASVIPASVNGPQAALQSSFAAPPLIYGLAPRLEPFPVAVAVLLHFITLGIFSVFHFNLLHGKLPRVRPDDPSAGRAIGFMFIPFFNFYWVFFSFNRLCLRVDEQRMQRGLPPSNLRGLSIAMCITMIIPYISFFICWPIIAPIFFGMMRSSVNELAACNQPAYPATPAAAAIGTARFCSKCGKPAAGQTAFCSSCGAAITPLQAPASVSEAGCKVEFDADGKVVSIETPPGQWAASCRGQKSYYTQKAGSLLQAAESLKKVSSIPQLTYYVVETPDGTLGRDINGYYTEAPIKTQNLRVDTKSDKSEPVELVSIKGFGNEMANLNCAAYLKQSGQYSRLVLLMKCGNCGYESPVETQAGDFIRECYCCGVKNKGHRGNVNVFVGSNRVEI